MFRIALTNLGKYNEGELVFKWIDLPIDDDALEAAKKEIGIDDYYEEWFITDYENDFNVRVDEYSDIEELNALAEDLEALDKWEAEIVSCLIENGYLVDDAIARCKDCMVYQNCYDMSDVAEQYINECGILDEIPEHLRSYFDFSAYGCDMELEGEFYYNGNGTYIEVIR